MSEATHAAAIHAPETEEVLAAVVKDAAAQGAPIEIVGGGTRRNFGRPVQTAQALSTAKLTGVTLYEPGALTIMAKAGTPLAEIEATLAAENQMLPFEPMDLRALLHGEGGASTIGGVVATGACGPRRFQAGACRDSLIGVRFVNGAGDVIKSGGRVMKNVTGYDLVKLMAGAFGELGVLTEVAFKVAPKPQTTATVLLSGLDDAKAIEALIAAVNSPFSVTGAAHLPTTSAGPPATLLRLEGFADSVEYRAQQLRARLAAFGPVEVEPMTSDTPDRWAAIRDCLSFAEQPGAVWRVTLRPSRAAAFVAAVRARRAAEAFYDWGGGLVWLSTPDEDDAGAAVIRGALAKNGGGDATLVRATETTRAAIDVFPPQLGPLVDLKRGLKEKFDPAGVLNPGRMG